MNAPNDTHNPPAVHLEGVWLLRNDRPILQDISWQVRAGEQAAILGPNGSGKSTLTRILLGYLWPTRGQVRMIGRLFGETNLNDLRTVVRLVQPTSPFEIEPQLAVREVVYTGYEGTLGVYSTMDEAQAAHVDQMIAHVGLSHVAGSQYGFLSTGERMRAQLARALVIRPQVLILDEPTSGLDIRAREELLAVLDQLAATANPPAMVMVTHHTEELPRGTTNVLLLDNGKASAVGTPAEVLKPRRLSDVYGCEVDVHTTEGRYYLHARSKSWSGA